jgi:hypothetical protein
MHFLEISDRRNSCQIELKQPSQASFRNFHELDENLNVLDCITILLHQRAAFYFAGASYLSTASDITPDLHERARTRYMPHLGTI